MTTVIAMHIDVFQICPCSSVNVREEAYKPLSVQEEACLSRNRPVFFKSYGKIASHIGSLHCDEVDHIDHISSQVNLPKFSFVIAISCVGACHKVLL